ncbi:DUF2183 domain-containing protein [Ornithinimicrobium sp. Arc0846-15]|nr:DUF2183 domain-containing protein [Ornithinimicrobium laminariae]
MSRPHIASLIEDAFFGSIESVLRARGWRERIIGYTGYGAADQVRVLGRVLLSREGESSDPSSATTATRQEIEEADVFERGWKAFLTAPAANTPVRVQVGAASGVVRTDRGGNLDATVSGHGLEPGWHRVTLSVLSGDEIEADVNIVSPDAAIGLVSDIDDTVMVTHLPRPLIAAWNTFVRNEEVREEVPGMAAMYRSLLAEHEGTPIFYVSTGAWNTAPTLTRFMRRHDYPDGPMLLTDWGPTNTGWFRSGQAHKRGQLARLAKEFPDLNWVLVGDDGQHDPAIYSDFADDHPKRVEAIAIRQLSPAQQFLSHGLPIATDELLGRLRGGIPIVRAPDGFTLHTLIQSARRRRGRLAESSWVPKADQS